MSPFRFLQLSPIWGLLGILWTPAEVSSARTREKLAEQLDIAPGGSPLATLDASNVPFTTADHWEEFFEHLTPHTSTLRTLSMTNTNMTAAHFVALMNLFTDASVLETLVVDNNPLSFSSPQLDAVTTHISTLVTLSAQNCTLIKTDLANRFISWTAYGQTHSPLETINLTGSPVTFTSGDVHRPIKWGATLTTLGLGGTGLEGIRIIKLLRILRAGFSYQPLHIKHLDISGTTWSTPAGSDSDLVVTFASIVPQLETFLARGVKFQNTSSFWEIYPSIFTFSDSLKVIDISAIKGIPASVCSNFVGIPAIIAQSWTLADTLSLLNGIGNPLSPPSPSWHLTLDLSNGALTTASTVIPKNSAKTWCQLAAQIPQLSRLVVAGNPLGVQGVLNLAVTLKGFWSGSDAQESLLDVSRTLGTGTLTTALFTALLNTGVDWIVLGGHKLGSSAPQILNKHLISGSAPSSSQGYLDPPRQQRQPGVITQTLPNAFWAMNAASSLSQTIATTFGASLAAFISTPSTGGSSWTEGSASTIRQTLTKASIQACATGLS